LKRTLDGRNFRPLFTLNLDSNRGCQMVYIFSYQKSQFGYIYLGAPWNGKRWYTYFMIIWNILQLFDILCKYLVYFMCFQENSGNPASNRRAVKKTGSWQSQECIWRVFAKKKFFSAFWFALPFCQMYISNSNTKVLFAAF
jgi:hypothetical protein